MINNIRQIIEDRGYKVSTIIEKTGLSKSYFYDVMNGNTVPTIKNARKIADVMGVRLDDIFPEDQPKDN